MSPSPSVWHDTKPQQQQRPPTRPLKIAYVEALTRQVDEDGRCYTSIEAPSEQYALVAYDDECPVIVRHYLQTGDHMQPKNVRHTGQWLIRYTGDARDSRVDQIVRMSPHTADLKVLSADERKRWWQQAIMICALDYGIMDLDRIGLHIKCALFNGTIESNFKGGYDMQAATNRLHFYAARNMDADGNTPAPVEELGYTKKETPPMTNLPDIGNTDDPAKAFPESTAAAAARAEAREAKAQPDGKPYPEWLHDESKRTYAFQNHFKRDLNVGTSATLLGWHVKQCYGTDVLSYLAKNGPEATYDRMVAYCANPKVPPPNLGGRNPPVSAPPPQADAQPFTVRASTKAKYDRAIQAWMGEDNHYVEYWDELTDHATQPEMNHLLKDLEDRNMSGLLLGIEAHPQTKQERKDADNAVAFWHKAGVDAFTSDNQGTEEEHFPALYAEHGNGVHGIDRDEAFTAFAQGWQETYRATYKEPQPPAPPAVKPINGKTTAASYTATVAQPALPPSEVTFRMWTPRGTLLTYTVYGATPDDLHAAMLAQMAFCTKHDYLFENPIPPPEPPAPPKKELKPKGGTSKVDGGGSFQVKMIKPTDGKFELYDSASSKKPILTLRTPGDKSKLSKAIDLDALDDEEENEIPFVMTAEWKPSKDGKYKDLVRISTDD